MAFESVRVAAVQATPVILDGPASIEKAARLLHQAADGGARLAVLPETFVPLYPSNRWARAASAFSGMDALWERLWQNSVAGKALRCMASNSLQRIVPRRDFRSGTIVTRPTKKDVSIILN